MGTQAVLVDAHAVTRISITLAPGHPVPGTDQLVLVRVCGPQYWAQGRAELSNEATRVHPLPELLNDFRGSVTFSLWGLGDYRLEGPLLTCRFGGDGLGHFSVDMQFAEGTLRLTDRFITDQSCVATFIADLQTLSPEE